MKAALAAGCCFLLLPVLVIGAAMGGVQLAQPSPNALADIPPTYLALYQEAATELGIPWELLAAIGKVESDHGRNPASQQPNAAGAEGPMQFLPATFAAYSFASDNPNPNVYNPRDAIYAAAALLVDNNLRDDPRQALYAYNHAGWYVNQVLRQAAVYKADANASGDPNVLEALAGRFASTSAQQLSQQVLADPNIQLLAEAAGDIRAGRVDPRVLAVLLALAERYQLGNVGPFVSGHSYYVAGTDRPSNHAFGRAVDIGEINRVAVSAANGAARSAALSLATLPTSVRPTEIGSPFADLPGPPYFSDADHQDHIHVGFDR